jgi:hypothetical protein
MAVPGWKVRSALVCYTKMDSWAAIFRTNYIATIGPLLKLNDMSKLLPIMP